MIISPLAFSFLVAGALVLVVLAPVILLTMLLRDWRNGNLW